MLKRDEPCVCWWCGSKAIDILRAKGSSLSCGAPAAWPWGRASGSCRAPAPGKFGRKPTCGAAIPCGRGETCFGKAYRRFTWTNTICQYKRKILTKFAEHMPSFPAHLPPFLFFIFFVFYVGSMRLGRTLSPTRLLRNLKTRAFCK